MIGRIWHGWTTPDDAAAYERLLKDEVLPGIAAKNVPGYRGVTVYRQALPDRDEVEFITLMRFESEDAIRRFVGDDVTIAHVPPKARALLKRFDERSRHYEIRETLEY